MNKRKKLEKIGAVVLVALCVFLVFKLVSEIMGNPNPSESQKTTATSYFPPSASPKSPAGKSASATSLDSAPQIQPLAKYLTKPAPDISRDPFDFGPPPLTPAQKAMQAARAAAGAMSASSAASSPQMPLRAIGYSEKLGVGPEAYLTDADQVYIVHDGDVVSRRFKVLKITSLIVEIQDGASGEKAQLPIPLVQ